MKCRLYMSEISVGTVVCDPGLFKGGMQFGPLRIDFCMDDT